MSQIIDCATQPSVGHGGIDMLCPLGCLENVKHEGYQFYSPKRRDEARPSPWKRQYPSDDQLRPIAQGGAAEMIIDRKRWVRVPIETTWSLASDDVNAGAQDLFGPHKLTPRHLHTEFQFAGRTIHIDFVRFMSWGPLSGFEEFQFFVDGQFASRGGYFACYGIFARSMPACFRTPEYAIVATGSFTGSILPTYDGLSGWLIRPLA